MLFFPAQLQIVSWEIVLVQEIINFIKSSKIIVRSLLEIFLKLWKGVAVCRLACTLMLQSRTCGPGGEVLEQSQSPSAVSLSPDWSRWLVDNAGQHELQRHD